MQETHPQGPTQALRNSFVDNRIADLAVLISTPVFRLGEKLNPITVTIDLTASCAALPEIGTTKIDYTLTNSDNYYGKYVTPIVSSFTVTIICPPTYKSFNAVNPITAASYELSSGKAMEIVAPEIAIEPCKCFSVVAFIVTDSITGEDLPYVKV